MALVDGRRGSFLFIDVDLDDRLTESERIPYTLAEGHTEAQEVSFNVRLNAPDVSLPVRGQVFGEKRDDVGSPVQDFSFTDFDWKVGRLTDYRGKYLLLDFWGSWCKPCVTDVPAMKEAHSGCETRGSRSSGSTSRTTRRPTSSGRS